jgi:hypothetical protein
MATNRSYTDEDMLQALRSVAEQLGTRVLSGPVYERHRDALQPRRLAISTRFGAWRTAVWRAGLTTTVKGGLQIPCIVCGTPFAGDRGKKARKTCSQACADALFAATRPASKGDASTPQAARGRARSRVELLNCGRCGAPVAAVALEVHHRDRDPYNNAPENLEVLCRACHKAEHRLPDRECGWCHKTFRPRHRRQTLCSRQCSGKSSASKRG